jgi:hypothetical protein
MVQGTIPVKRRGIERLGRNKAAGSSIEALLVDILRSSAPRRPSPADQRRVLEHVLSRARTGRAGPRRLLSPVVALALVLALLLVAGVTAAATIRRDWVAWGWRALAGAPTADDKTAAPVNGSKLSYGVKRSAAAPLAISANAPFTPAPGATAAPAEPAEPPLPEMRVAPTARQALKAASRLRAASTEDPSAVADALRALRNDHDPANASRLLAEYLQAYPHGALAEEALALSIEAAAGRNSPDAAAFAEAYLRQHPAGRFVRVAREALAQRR